MGHKRAQLAKPLMQKDTNILNAELGHALEVIAHATTKAMGLYLTGMFKPCEDCALGKA